VSTSRRIHRALAWIAAVTALVWASSGAFHPLIVAIGPKPVAFQPPRASFEAAAAATPAEMLARAGIAEASQLRYVAVDGRAALQVLPVGAGERRYLDAASGAAIAGADQARAIALARHYSGEQTAAVRETRLVERFDRDYPWINRLLPVWAVAFEGEAGVIVYVDTGGDRLGTMSGARKRYWQGLFQTLHTLSFIELPYLRPAAVGLMVGVLFAMAAFGSALLFRRGGRQPGRRFHRRLAYVALLPALLFPATGLFKLLVGQLPYAAAPMPPAILASSLSALPFAAGDGALLEAVAVPLRDSAPVWRLASAQGEVTAIQLRGADGSTVDGGDGALARRIAAAAFGQPVAEPLTELRRFDRDYGFANKRLPVWKAAGPDGRDWYFETRSGLVAAQVGGLPQLQAQVFDLLHKGQLFNRLGLSLEQRDLLMSALAATIVLTALFGLLLRGRRRSPEQQR